VPCAADTRKAKESGVGFVHNTLLIDHPAKSVLSMPWRVAPKPIWHAVSRCDVQIACDVQLVCVYVCV